MDLQSLLKLKIEKELIQELNDHFKDDSLQNIIQQKVKEKIKQNEITIDKPKKKMSPHFFISITKGKSQKILIAKNKIIISGNSKLYLKIYFNNKINNLYSLLNNNCV